MITALIRTLTHVKCVSNMIMALIRTLTCVKCASNMSWLYLYIWSSLLCRGSLWEFFLIILRLWGRAGNDGKRERAGALASLLSFPFPTFRARCRFPLSPGPRPPLATKQHERGLCGGESIWSLTKKRANVILTLTPSLTHVKGGIKYLVDLSCIWFLSSMSVLTRVKGVQRHYGFAYLWSLLSKAVSGTVFKGAMALHNFDPTSCHVASCQRWGQIWPYPATPL